jgi:hypothetical protein
MTRPRPAWPAQRLGDAIEEATMLARLARDLPGFLRTPLRPDQVESRIRHGLDSRRASFLPAKSCRSSCSVGRATPCVRGPATGRKWG